MILHSVLSLHSTVHPSSGGYVLIPRHFRNKFHKVHVLLSLQEGLETLVCLFRIGWKFKASDLSIPDYLVSLKGKSILSLQGVCVCVCVCVCARMLSYI